METWPGKPGSVPETPTSPEPQCSGERAVSPKPAISALTVEFGRRVRERRTELRLSQEQLAELAGLHWTFVGQIERGRRNLTLHNIVKLARALGLDAGTLMAGLQDLDETRRG